MTLTFGSLAGFFLGNISARVTEAQITEVSDDFTSNMNVVRNFFVTKVRYIKPLVATVAPRSFSNTSNIPNIMDAKTAKDAAKRIVWVDMEMTGLDIDKDHILEIACLITDADLNVIATGPSLVIHQPDSVLYNMNEWCINQHNESGLTQASRQSKITVNEAEHNILDFVRTYIPEKRCPLGGNSVYMDRLFIRKYMPKFDNYLHYRIIDVSSIKELAKRWYQKDFSNIPEKKFSHRAIDDIIESINELKYYRSHIFKS